MSFRAPSKKFVTSSMTLQVASLNSGSNGNCYYVGTAQDAILVDAGLSCRETERRMKRLGLNIRNVKGIFISHEHGDHISGIGKLVKRFGLPIYITRSTHQFSSLELPGEHVRYFDSNQSLEVGTLKILPFPKLHDAVDPHSFLVSAKTDSGEDVRVGIFTDIGVPCERVIEHFSQCHAAFLESNYDEMMLERGTYPQALKNRIRGGQGHLSNKQALQLFREYRPAFMTHLFLSHLSHHNNTPSVVQRMFDAHAGNTKIVIASRYRETELFTINPKGTVNESVARKTGFSYQLDLFR